MMVKPMDIAGNSSSKSSSSNSITRCQALLLALVASLTLCVFVGTSQLRSSSMFAPVVTPLVLYTTTSSGTFTASSTSCKHETDRHSNHGQNSFVSHIRPKREDALTAVTGEFDDRTAPIERDDLEFEQHLQRRPSYVKKAFFSDKIRFVFIASQAGTGHHGWRTALIKNHICRKPMTSAFQAMWQVFFRSSSSQFHENTDKLRQSLRENVALLEQELHGAGEAKAEPVVICLNTLNAPMMSYPNGGFDAHPDINLLARIAEEAGVDLRIITLHRPPANVIVSCSVHRNFGTPYLESHLQVDQTAILISQLESLDPSFYACTSTSRVVENAAHLQDHVFGGLAGSFTPKMVYALNSTFIDREDNETKARMEIHEKLLVGSNNTDARSIDRVLDELETSYHYFRDVVCANKRR